MAPQKKIPKSLVLYKDNHALRGGGIRPAFLKPRSTRLTPGRVACHAFDNPFDVLDRLPARGAWLFYRLPYQDNACRFLSSLLYCPRVIKTLT